MGKDLFYFIISDKGDVIPYGGNAYKQYSGDSGNPLWQTGCASSKIAPSAPLTCAGSVVDNGYKVIY